MHTYDARARRRPAFTLIELLVVIALIILLATLALLLAPRFSERQRTSMGASQLQGWLFNAKQRAYRDRMVRGVRFLPATLSQTAVVAPGPTTVTPADISGIHVGSVLAIDGNQELVTVQSVLPGPPPQFVATFTQAHAVKFAITPGRATDLQYTEQPDNFAVPGSSISQGTGTSVTITFPPPPAGAPPINLDLTAMVSPGPAYLFLRGGTESHLIQGATFTPASPPGNPNATGNITLATPLLSDIGTSSQIDYWIQLAPQPLASEPILSLPKDIVVDFFPNTSPQWQSGPSGQAPPPYVYDILFTPNGTVQQRGTAAIGKVTYWVHDASLDSPFQGEPTLISVYTNTGGIAAHQVNADDAGQALNNNSYYYFTQDGRSSGM